MDTRADQTGHDLTAPAAANASPESSKADQRLYSIVVPVYNEGPNIRRLLEGVRDRTTGRYEILICYDFDEDNTLPAIAAMERPPQGIRLIRNRLGKGVVNAIRAGFQAAEGDCIVVVMADLSDPPEDIIKVVEKLRAGADVVAGSRYMPGGRQIGGPRFKRFLSRMAGLSAYYVTSMPIRDITTNFRGYSRRVATQIEIESTGGFELALELTVKAHQRGWRVDEIPTTWTDRTAGESRFRLMKWLPKYLRWYGSLLRSDFRLRLFSPREQSEGTTASDQPHTESAPRSTS